MIKVENVTRRFGSTTAVANVSFEIPRGQAAGFIGANGSGKTTLLRMLAACLAPSEGRILIGGMDVFSNSLEVRRRTGYLPEQARLYERMRVGEYLSFRSKLIGVSSRSRRDRIEEIKALCGIKETERRLIGHLSNGYRRRVALADSLMHNSELLILDEPLLWLDPRRKTAIRDFLNSLGRRITLVLATRSPAEALGMCQRVFLMKNGRIEDPSPAVSAQAGFRGKRLLILEIDGPEELVTEQLRTIPGALDVRTLSKAECADGLRRRYGVSCEPGFDIRSDVFSKIVSMGWRLLEMSFDSVAFPEF